MDEQLWQPTADKIARSHMRAFIEHVQYRFGMDVSRYDDLHRWSVDEFESFWHTFWEFAGIVAEQAPEKIYRPGPRMQDGEWFAGAQLNFARNLLRRHDHQQAIIAINEAGACHNITFEELHLLVADLAARLRELGVQPGDRVAGFLPNDASTVIAMLACASLGAVWTACSPDFGLSGLLDRFGQIEPKILFAVDQHHYKGKTFHHLETIKALQTQLPSLQHTFVVSYTHEQPDIQSLENATFYDYRTRPQNPPPLEFTSLPFNHPLYILYSSGTTGQPKCMVHGAGGTLIQHLKELMLHTNLHPDERILFYTTCGWMMWHWMVSSLAIGATVVLYDGSPVHPTPNRLFDLIDEYYINVLGIGAKLLETTSKAHVKPKNTHLLNTLRTVLTTGSPLLPDSFDYVYNDIKQDLCLSSISGGSDIISCFALGNPMLPVYRGELQCIGLGMDVKVFNEHGHSVRNEKGELVCASPFPSMPIYFWNDADGKKYQHAYFDAYPNVWAHGDYAEITKHNGMIIYGRSDATLNPSGVRLGTAEIYQQVEKIDEVVDCLAVGHQHNDNERIILFVKLRDGLDLTDDLCDRIRKIIRDNASPLHVPAEIHDVPDLPRTISGKVVELAVKNIIHNRPVQNRSALANPESLEYFKAYANAE